MKTNPLHFVRQNVSFFTGVDAPNEENLNKINYVLRKNGLWEVRKNSIATFYVQLSDQPLLGFPDEGNSEWEQGFCLHVPKIPKVLLEQTISFFKSICAKIKAEAYVQFVYNANTKEYRVICPKQEVTGARVSYAPTILEEGELLVCEIHSHNTMDAFFSSIDDEDETNRGDRFFGVIGKLDSISPAIKMSFISGRRDRVIVDVQDVFDTGDLAQFPEEWIKNVREPKKIKKVYNKKSNGVIYEKEIEDFDHERASNYRQRELDAMLSSEGETEPIPFDTMFYGIKGCTSEKRKKTKCRMPGGKR
jgi:PRTRC genetic system protein A